MIEGRSSQCPEPESVQVVVNSRRSEDLVTPVPFVLPEDRQMSRLKSLALVLFLSSSLTVFCGQSGCAGCGDSESGPSSQPAHGNHGDASGTDTKEEEIKKDATSQKGGTENSGEPDNKGEHGKKCDPEKKSEPTKAPPRKPIVPMSGS